MKEGSSLYDLFIHAELERQDRVADTAVYSSVHGELRSVSARIDSSSYELLELLSERWAVSKSMLAANILMAALEDLKPPSESTPKSRAL